MTRVIDSAIHRLEDQRHTRGLGDRGSALERRDDLSMHLLLGHAWLVVAGDDRHELHAQAPRDLAALLDLLHEGVELRWVVHPRLEAPAGELADLELQVLAQLVERIEILA